MVDKRIDELGLAAGATNDLLMFWDANASATKQNELQELVPLASHYYSTTTQSVAGALALTRRGRAYRVDVTVSANITSWTDNMTNGDVLQVFLLGDGGTTDYTADLSALDNYGGNVGTLDIYPDTEIELVITKRGSNLWTATKTWADGTPAGGGGAVTYRGAATTKDLAAVTVPAGTIAGDTTIVVATAGGASNTPYPSGGTWGTVPALAGATKFAETLGLSYQPSIAAWTAGYDGDASYTAGYNFDSQCAVITFDGTASTVTHTAGRGPNGTPVSPIDWGSGVTRAAGDIVLAYCTNLSPAEPPATDPTDWTRIVAHQNDFNQLVMWRYTGSATGTITPSTVQFTGGTTDQHATGYFVVSP